MTEQPSGATTSSLYVVEHQGKRITFDCPSHVSRERARGTLTKEPGTIAWIDGFAPGAILWDIGANVGTFSLYAGVMRDARVYAFEPGGPTFNALVRNIVLNKIDRSVTAVPAAIDNRCHIADLRMRDDTPGSALHTFGTDIDYTGSTFEVAYLQGAIGVSIDALVSVFGLPVPHHVKIDVDGLERAVIAGGKATFADPACQSVLIELDLEDTAEVEEITATLRACGLERDDSLPGNRERRHAKALVYNMLFRR